MDFTLIEVQKVVDSQPNRVHVWKITMATKSNGIFLATGECEICKSMGITEWHETPTGWIFADTQSIIHPLNYAETDCSKKEKEQEEQRRIAKEQERQRIEKEKQRKMEERRLQRIEEEKIWKKRAEWEREREKQEKIEAIEDAKIEDAKKRKEELEELAETDPQIAANLKIINKFTGKLRGRHICSIYKLRRDLAIYRLYRYCNLNVWQLSELTPYSRNHLQHIIGNTFRLLCLSDKACIFRKILAAY